MPSSSAARPGRKPWLQFSGCYALHHQVDGPAQYRLIGRGFQMDDRRQGSEQDFGVMAADVEAASSPKRVTAAFDFQFEGRNVATDRAAASAARPSKSAGRVRRPHG
jgi:hypothetical protein